jgi:hypothetical protein
MPRLCSILLWNHQMDTFFRMYDCIMNLFFCILFLFFHSSSSLFQPLYIYKYIYMSLFLVGVYFFWQFYQILYICA